MSVTTLPADGDRAFLGHPRGLGYLVFAEAWERFSYYGMQSLLVLYMTQQLFMPGHIEQVAGFAGFRAGIESLYGRLSPAALASAIFGVYAGCVYLTPIVGGILADRVLGRTRTVALGACLMAVGHFLMAFEQSFLAALACLLIGVGCFKGNIASQVGELYGPDDPRRADAFQIFLLGVNVAVIVSPLVCGTLGAEGRLALGFRRGRRRHGDRPGGLSERAALASAGRRHRAASGARAGRAPRVWRPASSRRSRSWSLLLPVLALAGVGNQEIFNAYIVWGDANYELDFFGQSMPVTWLVSMDAFISFGDDHRVGGVLALVGEAASRAARKSPSWPSAL